MFALRRYITPSLFISAFFITLFTQSISNVTVHAQLGESLGEIVFASNRDGDFDIYVMNGEGGQIRQLTDNDARDTSPRWSPDGSQIAFISARDIRGDNVSLYVMDADGANLRSLSTDNIGITDFSFDWSPDSSQIAFSFDPNYVFDSYTTTMEIFSVDVESGEITQITDNDLADANPVWSPDGTQIAFLSYIDEPSGARFPDLFVIDVESHTVRRFTEGSASDLYPIWSDDGTQIMFASYGGGGSQIMVAGMESGDIAPVTSLELGDSFDPQWSPDESWILFITRYYDERGTELGLMDATGEAYIVLAQNERSGFDADWSPDSTQIVYISDTEDDLELYIVNPDGSGNKRLTNNDATDYAPHWRPILE